MEIQFGSGDRGATRQMGDTGLVVFFGIFALIGGIITAAFVYGTVQKLGGGWVPVEAVVKSVQIDSFSPPFGPYTPKVEFAYVVNGTTYTGTRVTPDGRDVADYGDAAKLVEGYTPGQKVTAYHAPGAAENSALRLEPADWTDFAPIAFPGAFLAFGLVGMFFALRKKLRGRRSTAKSAGAGNGQLSRGAGLAIGAAFFGVFLIIGVSVFFAIGYEAVRDWLGSKAWTATPATVVDARVTTHADADSGNTYSVDCVYEYVVNGKTYRSNRYGWAREVSSGGSEDKQSKVNTLKRGASLTALVNPADPWQAVVDRSPNGDLWFSILFPGAFAAFGFLGVVGMLTALVRGPKTPAPGAAGASNADGTPVDPDVPLGFVPLKPGDELKTETSRVGGFVVLVFITLIWNAITWGFLLFGSKSSDACGLVFVGVFAVIGLLLVGFCVQTFLSLFNPKPVLTVERGELRLGTLTRFKYRWAGRYDKLTKLTITVEGREKATYHTGSGKERKSHTVTEVFFTQVLLETNDLARIESGTLDLTLPALSVPSLKAGNSEIQWRVLVRGEIPRWPDVKDDYEIPVLPLPKGTARSGRGAAWLQ
jgi:hypothetical protein